MACATKTPDNSTALRELSRRIRDLTSRVSGAEEVFGVCMSAAQLIVPPVSATYDPETGTFTVVFPSVPGEHYQIQKSVDGITWLTTTGGTFVAAAVSPATTTEWTSTETWFIDALPIYFRIRLFPRAYIAAPASTCP
jgi:hypothetical protein